ncbi:Protein of unknown function [Cotesia congregata]|uniref:Uncharacterized protein n=1 Tax=Cotesia congregata TaxID=51543 RepID=A0A8J2HFS9_COTCN|nr:Protein of unknown function [Cotesia congregata]
MEKCMYVVIESGRFLEVAVLVSSQLKKRYIHQVLNFVSTVNYYVLVMKFPKLSLLALASISSKRTVSIFLANQTTSYVSRQCLMLFLLTTSIHKKKRKINKRKKKLKNPENRTS